MGRTTSHPPGPVLLFALRLFMLCCLAFSLMAVRWIWYEWQWLEAPQTVEISGVASHFRHSTTKSSEDRWTFRVKGHARRIAFVGDFAAPPDDVRVPVRVRLRADNNALLGDIAPPPADVAYGVWIGEREVVSPRAAMARARDTTVTFTWMACAYLLLTLGATCAMFLIAPRRKAE